MRALLIVFCVGALNGGLTRWGLAPPAEEGGIDRGEAREESFAPAAPSTSSGPSETKALTTRDLDSKTGVVEGSLTSALFRPIVGATVVLIPREDRNAAPIDRAETDAFGSFRFEEVPDGSYDVRVLQAPVAMKVSSIDGVPAKVDADRPSPFVKIDARRLYEVLLDLRYPDGSRPASATLQVFGKPQEWLPDRVLTVEEVRTIPDPGLSFVQVIIDGIEIPIATKFEEDRVERPLTIDLPWSGAFEIEVVGVDVEAGTRITFAAIDRDAPLSGPLLEERGSVRPMNSVEVELDEQGVPRASLYWDAIPPGRYAIGVSRKHQPIAAQTVVTVDRSPVPVSITLPPPRPSIPVRVFAPDGTPIEPQLQLNWILEHERVPLDFAQRIAADGAIEMLLDVLSEGLVGAPDVTLELWIRSTEYGSTRVPFTGAPITVTFEEPAEVTFVVIDENDVESLPELGRPAVITVQNAEGQFLGNSTIGSEEPLRAIPPGEIRWSIQSGNWLSSTWVEGVAVVHSGPNRIEIRIPRRHTVAIHPAPGRRRSPALYPTNLPARPCHFANEVTDSVFFYYGIEAGEYAVQWPAESALWMPITIPRDSEVTLEPRPIETMRWLFPDEEPPVAGPFRSGDVIVIDEIVTAAALQSSPSPAPREFTVLRDGEWITIEGTIADLRTGERAGGMLVPVDFER